LSVLEGRPGAEAEIEWQFEAQDLRLVLRWIESAAGAGADPVTVAAGRTVNHVDTYLDTEDRRLDRAGYSVRLRRSRRPPDEATIKSLDGAGPDALRVRVELVEPLERDDPATVRDAPGPVGKRVRALVGSRKPVPLFDLQTKRRLFPIEAGGAPSGQLLLNDGGTASIARPLATKLAPSESRSGLRQQPLSPRRSQARSGNEGCKARAGVSTGALADATAERTVR
jgi:hypothetical protein